MEIVYSLSELHHNGMSSAGVSLSLINILSSAGLQVCLLLMFYTADQLAYAQHPGSLCFAMLFALSMYVCMYTFVLNDGGSI